MSDNTTDKFIRQYNVIMKYIEFLKGRNKERHKMCVKYSYLRVLFNELSVDKIKIATINSKADQIIGEYFLSKGFKNKINNFSKNVF